GVGLATELTLRDLLKDIAEDNLPVVDLAGDDNAGRQLGLVGLRSEREHAVRLGHSDGTDDHLGATGQNVRATLDVRVSRLGCQRDVTERADVVLVYAAIGVLSQEAGLEAVNVQRSEEHTSNSSHVKISYA